MGRTFLGTTDDALAQTRLCRLAETARSLLDRQGRRLFGNLPEEDREEVVLRAVAYTCRALDELRSAPAGADFRAGKIPLPVTSVRALLIQKLRWAMLDRYKERRALRTRLFDDGEMEFLPARRDTGPDPDRETLWADLLHLWELVCDTNSTPRMRMALLLTDIGGVSLPEALIENRVTTVPEIARLLDMDEAAFQALRPELPLTSVELSARTGIGSQIFQNEKSTFRQRLRALWPDRS